MKTCRTPLALGISMMAASLTYGWAAHAAEFPSEPIRIVVPYTAGATNDAVPRIIGPKLSEILGQPVLVENRPGAGGDIGVNHVIASKPDGHTLLMTSNALITREVTSAKPAYRVENDLRPIMLVGDQPMVLVVARNFKADNVKDLLTVARTSSPSLSYATPGAGTPHQLAAELMAAQGGIDLLHIPYKGTAASLVDTAAERVTMTWATPASARALLEGNKIKAVGVTASERLASMPNVPTFTESNLKGLESGFWYGFTAPKQTPDAVIAKLHGAFKQALADPEVTKQILDLGITIKPLSPEEFQKLIDTDHAQWQQVAKSANISVEP